MACRVGLIALALAFALGGCISQPIVVQFPADANWHFEYRDAHGEYLGFGKATLSFRPESRSFVMTIVENAFGDSAALRGTVGEAKPDTQRVPFTASGTWFDGRPFGFAGDFNLAMDRILDCSAAFLETERLALGASLGVLATCRAAVARPPDDPAALERRLASARNLGEMFLERAFTFAARRIAE